MASKALAKMRAKMEEQAASARKRFASFREKAGSPKTIIGMVLVGLLAGALLPRAVGTLDRSKRRYVRIGLGAVLLILAWRKKSPIMWLGVGVLASEALFSGVEYLAPKLGMSGIPEIGELPAASEQRMLAARREVFGAGERVYPELAPTSLP